METGLQFKMVLYDDKEYHHELILILKGIQTSRFHRNVPLSLPKGRVPRSTRASLDIETTFQSRKSLTPSRSDVPVLSVSTQIFVCGQTPRGWNHGREEGQRTRRRDDTVAHHAADGVGLRGGTGSRDAQTAIVPCRAGARRPTEVEEALGC